MIVLSLLSQVGSVRGCVLLDKSQTGRVFGGIAKCCGILGRILAGIGFQGGVGLFGLVSGRIRGGILGRIFHGSRIGLDRNIRLGRRIGLNRGDFANSLVLSRVS